MSINMNNIEMRASASPWRMGVSLWVFGRNGNGERVQATNLVMSQKLEGEDVPALVTLDMTAAQVLMDDLWDSGVRPTEGAGSAGAMRAVERHLEDMRKLVFEKGGSV